MNTKTVARKVPGRVYASALLASLLGVPAVAEVVTFIDASGWQAFGGNASDGRKLCGVSTNGGGRWLGVKYFDGDQNLTVQLSKDTWQVRKGAQVNVHMQFDSASPWKAVATAFYMGNGDGALQFQIGRKQIPTWISEFRESNVLYVSFPDNDVEDWQADLAGTVEIVEAMGLCLEAMEALNQP